VTHDVSVDPYQFGGSEKQVRRTQRRFAHVFAPEAPVLDVGCGRGVFLQLLRESGISAVGIDTYEPAVERCKQEGFTVYKADVLGFLPEHPEEFSGIFCSHVIEHLPFDQAARLLALGIEALKPEGLLVIVTPNPRDMGVIGETFWLDPTHVRPYPVSLVASMMEGAGLRVVDRGTFHGGLPKREWGRSLLYRLRLGMFFGHPNAYVVGRKPSE